MIDIGVASPSAHGQAMISTATALTIAYAIRGSGPNMAHTKNVMTAIDNHGGHEITRHDVREPLNRRTAALRFRHHLHDLREQRFAADAFRSHHERAVAVDRAADNALARLFLNRNRFARHHRFIDCARALEHDTIDRDFFARTHAQAIASRTSSSATSSSLPSGTNRRAVFGASPSRALIAAPVWLRAFSSST